MYFIFIFSENFFVTHRLVHAIRNILLYSHISVVYLHLIIHRLAENFKPYYTHQPFDNQNLFGIVLISLGVEFWKLWIIFYSDLIWDGRKLDPMQLAFRLRYILSILFLLFSVSPKKESGQKKPKEIVLLSFRVLQRRGLRNCRYTTGSKTRSATQYYWWLGSMYKPK